MQADVADDACTKRTGGRADGRTSTDGVERARTGAERAQTVEQTGGRGP